MIINHMQKISNLEVKNEWERVCGKQLNYVNWGRIEVRWSGFYPFICAFVCACEYVCVGSGGLSVSEACL